MRYAFSIDRGGTFTDCILYDRVTREKSITKVLSSDTAPLIGMRALLHLAPDEPLPPCDIRMGTTVATNTLLERSGARTALIITRGFADLLEIGDQTRPYLFELDIRNDPPLCCQVYELNARSAPSGERLQTPEKGEIEYLVQSLYSNKIESVALVTLHSYADPSLEEEIAEQIRTLWRNRAPLHLTLSSTLAPELGFLTRASTAVLDAYTAPQIQTYLSLLHDALQGSRLQLMQSSGGLASSERFRGPGAILSGPAGGIIAGEKIAAQIGSKRLVSFDMGGTSADVALIEGKATLAFEKNMGGIPIRGAVLDIHSIAAGGGSVCSFDGYGLTVGPRSVGSKPGPLCYQKDTPFNEGDALALTDINLFLGRLTEDHFSFPLDKKRAETGLRALATLVQKNTGKHHSLEDLARGFSAVATTNMAEAIRTVTTERGVELKDADLLVFGGAAGQHACSIATALGMRRIVVHRLSGVLSAHGIGQADTLWSEERDAGRRELNENTLNALDETLRYQRTRGEAILVQENPSTGENSRPRCRQSLGLRYRGTDHTIEIHRADLSSLKHAFAAEHKKLFGYSRSDSPLEIVTVRTELRITDPEQNQSGSLPVPSQRTSPVRLSPLRKSRICLKNQTLDDVPVYELSNLGNAIIDAPALIIDPTGTYLIDEGFQARLSGDLLMIEKPDDEITRESSCSETPLAEIAVEQMMATRFSAIAEQMGEALRRAAASTNIRDRLDFSCAVFDRQGRLVANAPHIPVHLGAMSESVRAVLEMHTSMQPGDAFLTNDPALGGSHLPDITVVTPVFTQSGSLLCFTASRGHHADVGGITPGSMPPFSTSIADEGVVFSAERILVGGEFLEKELYQRLSKAPYPARNPRENIADLKAQIAANHLGARLLLSMSIEPEIPSLNRSMATVRALAERWMRDAISAYPNGTRTFDDQLDDGNKVCVRIEVEDDEMHIDFSGTSDESPGNLNAPRAVTLACVLYVLRTLMGRPLPLNQGCMIPVRVTIPDNSLLNPSPDRAVAGGNVETSQRIVDVLLGALNLCAASQGTMNNLCFGNEHFGYYETIAGGAGAGPTFAGADAVHTHMTNTRISDAEELEARFPVRVHEFSIRRGSGGAGNQPGGNGIVREFEALESLEVSLITERREIRPFGLAGGESALAGKNLIDGAEVPAEFHGKLPAGSRIRIETPGGGGYGSKKA